MVIGPADVAYFASYWSKCVGVENSSKIICKGLSDNSRDDGRLSGGIALLLHAGSE